MEAFLITIQITAGILSPLILLGSIYLLIQLFIYMKGIVQYEVEELRRSKPYDLVETMYDFPTKKTIVRFYRKDKLIYEGEVTVNNG